MVNDKLDIILLPIKKDLDELFRCLWHLRNPIEAIRTSGIKGIEDFHKQLHVLNNIFNKLIIHIKELIPHPDYLIDDLKQGFNINNLTKIDSGVHSLDSINQVDFPIIEGSFLDLRETTRWSEPQVKNFRYFLDYNISRNVSLYRKLSQQFDINRTALENYLEHFRDDVAEHIKNFMVIPSTTDKVKALIKNMYEKEKEKINQKSVREGEKVIQDMHSRGILGSSIHINSLEEVQFNRIEALWKKRIEIEMHVRRGKINESVAREIYNEASNIIEAEIEVSKVNLTKITKHSGASSKSVLLNLDKKKKGFFVAAKRYIDIEIGKSALLRTKTAIPKEEKNKDFNQFLQTQFSYTKTKLTKKLKTVNNTKVSKIINEDIKIAVSCLMFKLWKPCVILCGGIIEGILGDKISPHPKTAIEQVYKKLYPKQKIKKIDDYTLQNFVDVALELGIIESGTASLAHGVRDYRNYIHAKKEAKEKHSISDKDANIACQTVFKILDEI